MKTGLVKKVALGSLRTAGVFSLVANSRRRRNRLLILCYHGISLQDEHLWRKYLHVTPEHFRQRLQLLKNSAATVLPLAEAVERLRTHSLPPRSVAITFDDGFYDFYRHALPTLQEFGFPCTLYLTTHYCRHRLPIFDLVVSYMLWKSPAPEISLARFGMGAAQPIRTEREQLTALQGVLAWAGARKLDSLAKDDIARALAEQLSIDYAALLESRL